MGQKRQQHLRVIQHFQQVEMPTEPPTGSQVALDDAQQGPFQQLNLAIGSNQPRHHRTQPSRLFGAQLLERRHGQVQQGQPLVAWQLAQRLFQRLHMLHQLGAEQWLEHLQLLVTQGRRWRQQQTIK